MAKQSRAKAKRAGSGKGSGKGSDTGSVPSPAVELPNAEAAPGAGRIPSGGDTLAPEVRPIVEATPPPARARKRRTQAEIAADKRAEEERIKAEEKKRRDAQAEDAQPALMVGLAYATKIVAGLVDNDLWALSQDEAEELSRKLAATLVKYVDLGLVQRYNEEVALAWCLGGIIADRWKRIQERAAKEVKAEDANA